MPHDDIGDVSFVSRNYRALGPDTRAVLLRRRMRMRAMAERLRMIDMNIGMDEEDQRQSLQSRMSPPVAIPLLTPTQIADRLEHAHRSPARSPGRSPGNMSTRMFRRVLFSYFKILSHYF